VRKKFRCNFMVIQKPSALARARQSLYGAARIGDFVVISNYRPSSSGWAIILLSVTALALGGCGRKGGLDLPPNAPPQASATSDTETERAAQPGVFNSTHGAEAGPSAPKGSKKKFILDPLLD
jgi:predicted small lipoprotein YifL